MNYLEVYMMGRAELFEVARAFPATHKHIRMCAAKLALRRDIILRARRLKQTADGDTLLQPTCSPSLDRVLKHASSTVTGASPGQHLYQQQLQVMFDQSAIAGRKRKKSCARFGSSGGSRRNAGGIPEDDRYSMAMSAAQSHLPSLEPVTPRGSQRPPTSDYSDHEAADSGETRAMIVAQGEMIAALGRSVDALSGAMGVAVPGNPSASASSWLRWPQARNDAHPQLSA